MRILKDTILLRNVNKNGYVRITPLVYRIAWRSKPAVCQFVKRPCDSSQSGSEGLTLPARSLIIRV